MKRQRKSTMVELVTELEKLLKVPGVAAQERVGLCEMVNEARAGEYHDYKNKKYVCGKVESSRRLREMGFIPLAQRIEQGEFDEEADAEDKAALKKSALAGGIPERACKEVLGL